jgi:DNA-binding transcriptional ArsR family regulator
VLAKPLSPTNDSSSCDEQSSRYDRARWSVTADVDMAAVGALFGERTRAAMLAAVGDGRALPAADLARAAGVSPATASAHLAKLVEGGILTSKKRGRHRYFAIANARVAAAIEALASVAPPAHAHSLREVEAGAALRVARTCYDHLAGRVGVAFCDALVRRHLIKVRDGQAEVTSAGERAFATFGLDLETLRQRRRPLLLLCLDWSEERHHLAGAIGAALAARMFELGWIERARRGRAVKVTTPGEDGLAAQFGVRPEAWSGPPQ